MDSKREFKKVVIRQNGTPDVLEIKSETLSRDINKGLLIEVWAFGVGWADIMAQRGGYALAPKKPFTPGYDFIGKIIDNCCSNQFQTGDMVAALLPQMGTYSELLEVDEKYLVKLPNKTPIDKAAASLLNYLTAYCIIEQKASIKDNDSVYIQGASGGVGIALSQIGKLKSLKMFGTTSKNKAELIKNYGVIPIDYKSENLVEIIRKSHAKGVDVAFDARGGKSLSDCIKVIKNGGVVVSYGFSGDNYGGNKDMLKGIMIILKNLFSSNGKQIKLCGTPSEIEKNTDWYKTTLTKIFKQINSGEINPLIHEIIPFYEIVKAHKLMEKGKLVGKIIVKTKYYKE